MNEYYERDTAVIPWLPQHNRSSRTPAASATRPCKIITLLSARERIGLKSTSTRIGSLSEGVLVSNEELSAAGAWNRRRMQNMILAVGPGTPASCVLTSVPIASDSVGLENESESNDENDIYNVDTDDELEMLESDHEEELEEGDSDAEVGEEEGNDSDDSNELEIVTGEAAATNDEDRSSTTKSKRGETNSDEDRLDAEAEIARHLAARPAEEGNTEGQESQQISTGRRSDWILSQERVLNALNGEDSDQEESSPNNQNASNNDSSPYDSGNDSRARRADEVMEYIEQQIIRQHQRRRRRSQLFSSAVARDETDIPRQYEREVARSMKHGGCINTASWLDCGWRISTVSHEDANPYSMVYNDEIFTSSSHSSNENYSTPVRQKQSYNHGLAVSTSPSEFPTQLITSGDDHVVKFWDVSQAMGSTSPLPGGSATINPFCSPRVPMKPTSELITKWRSHIKSPDNDFGDCSDLRHNRHLPGIVHPLLTLSTGHRGNVFHATPIPNSPGKVLTCAADGFLRMTDVEINATSSPASRTRGRSNSTSSTSNVGEASTIIISPEYHTENGESGGFRFRDSLMCFSHHHLNSNVGLLCTERGLLHFDIRLPPSSQKRGSLVEELSSTCKSCCVWKDYNEDSDTAYVFAGGSGSEVALYDLRMTGRASSQAVQRYRPRPLRRKSSVSVSGIDVSKDKKELLVSFESDQIYTFPIFPSSLSAAGPSLSEITTSTDDFINGAKPVPELAQYGGHLNRLTFLKMAKFAGPNDDYICTGSDSGHAWVYDKETGSVAAFIRADHSTCNGILPHPALPYFITYGIDSTVKLWRATIPIDENMNDSDAGRFEYSRTAEYKKSIVVDKWKGARKRNPVDLDEEMSFFPDETPIENVMEDSISLGFMGLLFSRTRTASDDPPFIGNDLSNLGDEIKKNYFACARNAGDGDAPVKSGIIGLKRRLALMKLRHHADCIGLKWDGNVPWNMAFKERLTKSMADENLISYGAPVNLIPEPSDWIPFHVAMTNPPLDCGIQFSKRHKQFYRELYVDRSTHPITRSQTSNTDAVGDVEQHEDDEVQKYDSSRSWDILYSTVVILKEAGNAALQKSLNCLAARYYDKAILYCALAYMEFPVGNTDFLLDHQLALSENSGCECRWTALLKTFIQIRLNMSLCYLKNGVDDTKAAIFQAKMALRELKPFVAKKGCVMTGKKLDRCRLEEPDTTYTEAKALQSKAYFRLGSAQFLLSEFDDAIESFEESIKSSSESSPEKKPDATVLRKLQEAKLANKRHCNSERKKFKFAFAPKEKELADQCEEASTSR